ncbi:cyclic nucleotide-binding domain-containing protein [Rhizobium sp. RCAM05350]|nr:cyclic nucleotide-binding domain-containing protein [Rhizobium sp. RCAM05350]
MGEQATAAHGASAFPYPPRPSQITLFQPDGEVYAQGDRSDAIYRVEFGAVRVYRLHADGRRQVVSFHLAGETFGLEAGRIRSFFRRVHRPYWTVEGRQYFRRVRVVPTHGAGARKHDTCAGALACCGSSERGGKARGVPG